MTGGTHNRSVCRFVAFDLESVVRPSVKEPDYKEQHIFQIGAVRFGPDLEWVKANRFFNAYVELPEDAVDLIHRDNILKQYREYNEPLADVLERFNHFCAEAEMLVAYNGTAHDFPLLEREYERAELKLLWDACRHLGPRLVDGLYLAQALWPIPPRQHRLAKLLERLGVKVEDLQWHDALDDAKMLVALLDHGGHRYLPSLDPELVELIASASKGSDAWELLFSLASTRPEQRHFNGDEVSHILAAALVSSPRKQPLRLPRETDAAGGEDEEPEMDGARRISIPAEFVDRTTSKVDIDRLVQSVKGEHSEARPAQREMVEQMRTWLDEDRKALVEAPTGTGKSYAILAVALDWLAADSRNRVVISTFTKQLQSQLAFDIERLGEEAIPELVTVSDMIKGARNRISLRALVIALTDLTELASHRSGARGHRSFGDDPHFRDLVLYLTLRFVADGKPTEEWESRSVDKVDVPAFFDDYCSRRLGLYLASLSQADAGEYQADRNDLARYTLKVREALEQQRLVIANHALLLAHLDAFENIGSRTLLVVDEAHELENAATSAIAPSLDSKMIGKLAEDVTDWLGDQPNRDQLRELDETVEAVNRFLEDERMQRSTMRAFDTDERDPLAHALLRVVTIASPLQGEAHVEQMEHLSRELKNAARYVGSVRAALRNAPEPTDPFDLDRLLALRARARELDNALDKIVSDIDAVLAPKPADEEEADGKQLASVGEGEEADELVAVENEEEPKANEEELEEAVAKLGQAYTPTRSNRVVWAEELEEFRPGAMHDYRFRITSSPIELGREHDWQDFLHTFAHVYYVSATLKVADDWGFMRERLALLEESVETIALRSPFDAARQARLVCFEDFPSWTEHDEAAMRTVAHQLAGYARELINGEQNGAMMLTTSRAAAAGIFDRLARRRVGEAVNYPLISAGIEGNPRAVEAFRREGGIIVGTRGLWQGVDIESPERLRLVWINKLPFAPFADPVVTARRELVRERAELEGVEDPDAAANERYYLPLAALSLRQAVGRLIRSREHHGVVIISDRKLAGPTRLHRLYREIFLGSLDPGLLESDPETDERAGGNIVTMREGWRRIFAFFAEHRFMPPERAEALASPEALEEFTELPETRAIAHEEISPVEEETLLAESADSFAVELLTRCERIAVQLNPERETFALKPKQKKAIAALAHNQDLLAILPTGYGKSYVFQLPALALSGVTIVISPLVSLMTDQALELNRTISGRVRALVAPMRESNSRTGKSEVHEELTGHRSHGIKLVYLSPERLCQRQFQDWIRAGVERGIVRRIAIDEAHTFVQWGDDFRPSLRRAENFLREVKATHPKLRLLALTATANETVREGLRRAIFGLKRGETRKDLAFVSANPLRPELALYRRSLPKHQGGTMSVAGLVERVVDALEGHAIFYCLTVRQVEQLYAHLSDYLQGHPVEVFRYHGRLTDAEKTGVANAFRSAPKRGEEGFRRMVVVATSAFGLGIDRPDLRAVFCVSPPTDLAALYQQFGRAGRDRAARPGKPGEYTAGLALMYPRASRTISFMTRSQIKDELFARIATSLLNADSPFSTYELANKLIKDDHEANKLSQDQAADHATADVYQAAVLRVLAELSQRGLLSDLGDFPTLIELRRGDYAPDTAEMTELVEVVLAEVLPNHVVEVKILHERLALRFGEEFSDPGALWSALLELHALGYLDVSQRPNRSHLTAIKVHSTNFPPDLISSLSRRQTEINREVELLRGWFSDRACANEGFRSYFAADALTEGCCETDDCRCSSCWSKSGLPEDAVEPRLYEAFMSDDLSPASASPSGRRRSEQQLDELIQKLLWHNRKGLGENLILAVLRGEDHYFNKTEKRPKRLWPSLQLSKTRGRKPGLNKPDLSASLARLEAEGQVAREGGLWRLTRHIFRDRAWAVQGDTTNGGERR